MQRSSSSSRVSEEFPKGSETTLDREQDPHHHHQLPTYDPLSHVAKKQRSRLRSAENAIHFIPLVLVLCAIVLWFFSNPELRI